LISVVAVALTGSAADAQPKSITSCGIGITATGAYVLNSNLTFTSTSGVCINVSANNVTIDLNGFVLTGKGGIASAIASAGSGLTVTNGSITGFGLAIFDPPAGARISKLIVTNSSKDENYAIYLGDSAQVSDSIFLDNAMTAIGLGANAIVTHCIIAGNGFSAVITRGSGAVITENSIAANENGGVGTSSKSTVEGNAATNNSYFDFSDTGGGTTYETNAAAGSTSEGFQCGSTVTGKILGNCVFVGNAADSNSTYGFEDAGGSIFRSNTADSNGVDGFFSEEGTGFNGNTADDNEFGFEVNCPVNLLGNTAEDNTNLPISTSSLGCNLQNNLGF
jgi:hypothetical protein